MFFMCILSSTYHIRIPRQVEVVMIAYRLPRMPRAQPRKKNRCQVRVELLGYERAACAM